MGCYCSKFIDLTLVTSLKLAKLVAQCAFDKKAEDIVILDMRKAANFCDYFVVVTGNSDRQIRAIANGIEQGLSEQNIDVRYKQGMKDGRWALLDLGDVVAHVFTRDLREFYGLDHLWQDAKKVAWEG